jgi:predicted DNA-binding transcriptional regulator AlpA
MSRSDLAGLVECTPATELPELIGDLEAARAAAWARLTAPASEPRPDAPRQEPRNLDVAEAARRLGMSRDWLYRHAAELPFALRIGRRVVFDSLALECWNRKR